MTDRVSLVLVQSNLCGTAAEPLSHSRCNTANGRMTRAALRGGAAEGTPSRVRARWGAVEATLSPAGARWGAVEARL
ncbi:hypothetical protein GCM10009682_59310 [Luedemannella flava]|uniref:Uncharacterized protein n=1 Tax=Luedemannella flava TaxID=349316 RepID=A0ABP4YZM8_9ACTN